MKTHGNSCLVPFPVQLHGVCSDFQSSVSSFLLSLKLKHLREEKARRVFPKREPEECFFEWS